MRLALLSLFLSASALYTGAAWHSYREELGAREGASTLPPEGFEHPEANLRVLREAIAGNDYADGLIPHLERSLEEAPSFYQGPLLMASFYANRLERPDLTRRSFEAALERFPTNGRLHLTYAQWLLTPRATAPYRAFRREAGPDSRELALDRLETGTALEPDLTQQALGLLLQAQVPLAEWESRLPPSESTKVLILDAADRSSAGPEEREELLREYLRVASTLELSRRLALYAERWAQPALALEAASKWRETALAANEGRDIVRATVAAARQHLDLDDSEDAYRLLRETISTIEARSLPSENALELLCLVADEYLRRRQGAMAQGLYSEAVALSPYYAPAYLGLSRNYRALGDLENARREVEEVLAFDPSNVDAENELRQIERLGAGRP